MLTSRDLVGVEFPVVRWREGYEIDEVTELLDRARATLESYEGGTTADRLTAADVRRARFQATKFRPGWDQAHVDAFLERIAERLTELEPLR